MLPNDQSREAISFGHLDDDLHDFGYEEAAVPADNQRPSRQSLHYIEDGLHEVLGVVRLLEHSHLLAKARSPRILIRKRLSWNLSVCESC